MNSKSVVCLRQVASGTVAWAVVLAFSSTAHAQAVRSHSASNALTKDFGFAAEEWNVSIASATRNTADLQLGSPTRSRAAGRSFAAPRVDLILLDA